MMNAKDLVESYVNDVAVQLPRRQRQQQAAQCCVAQAQACFDIRDTACPAGKHDALYEKENAQCDAVNPGYPDGK